MKKIAAILLCTFLLIPNALAAVDFTDFGGSHWAYPVVTTLVEKGTIRGYEDGTFRPENTVTRAEFATMMGKGTNQAEYTDTVGHWAEEVISTSEIPEISNGIFEPDTNITRGDAIEALWARYDYPLASNMPKFIENQGGAAAWAYSYGIMTGDDGVDLRLADTITRAEAAALIVRSENSKTEIGFAAALSNVTSEILFNSTRAFEAPYSENANITYKELARAVVLLSHSQTKPEYIDLAARADYESEYAKDMFVLGYYALGEDIINLESETKLASIADARKALEKIVVVMKTSAQSKIKFCLYPETNEEKAITHKEFAALLIQIDEEIGLELSYTISNGAAEDYKKQPVTTKKYALPANAASYKAILKDVPAVVYDTDISAAKKAPVDQHYFSTSFAPLFMLQCNKLATAAHDEYGTDIELTYYPTLCYDNGTGFTMMLKVKIVNPGTNGYTAEDLFGQALLTNPGKVLAAGDEFFVKINTHGYAINE